MGGWGCLSVCLCVVCVCMHARSFVTRYVLISLIFLTGLLYTLICVFNQLSPVYPSMKSNSVSRNLTSSWSHMYLNVIRDNIFCVQYCTDGQHTGSLLLNSRTPPVCPFQGAPEIVARSFSVTFKKLGTVTT